MKAQNVIAWVLVGVLGFLSIFQTVRRFDCSTCIQDADTVVTYVFVTDTIFVDVETNVPVPYRVDVIQWRTQFDTVTVDLTEEEIDSLLDQYYMEKYYSDTIADDYMIAIINDVVKKNMIWDREFEYAFVQGKVTTITEQVEVSKGAIFAGPYAGTTAGSFGLGASLLYKTKNDHMVALHGDVLNKGLYFSTYWKLSFKKN